MSERKIKIIFILPSLKAGGAERVISSITEKLNKSKFNCILIVAGYEKDSMYDTSSIETVFLNKTRVLKAIPSLYSHIRKKQPDIVLGSISHVNQVLAMFSFLFPKVIFVGREANVESVLKEFPTVKRRFNPFNYFYSNRFKYLDAIICQSNDMFNDIKENYDINEQKFVIINNPITDNFTFKQIESTTTQISYVTVGTLHPRKGYDRILKALSKLDHNFKYTIVGSGDKNSILKLSNKLELNDKINFISYSDKVQNILRKADVFLNGSYVEGFSNSILESCAVGTPVIAFNAPGGINEIIIEGVNGYIANSEYEFINYLNKTNKLNSFNNQEVSHSVHSRYSEDIILAKYENLFENLTFKRPINENSNSPS